MRRSRCVEGGRRARRELGPSGHGALRSPGRGASSVEEELPRADVRHHRRMPSKHPCGVSTGHAEEVERDAVRQRTPGFGQGDDVGVRAGRCVDDRPEESLGVEWLARSGLRLARRQPHPLGGVQQCMLDQGEADMGRRAGETRRASPSESVLRTPSPRDLSRRVPASRRAGRSRRSGPRSGRDASGAAPHLDSRRGGRRTSAEGDARKRGSEPDASPSGEVETRLQRACRRQPRRGRVRSAGRYGPLLAQAPRAR
jgi:hypothetical protein